MKHILALCVFSVVGFAQQTITIGTVTVPNEVAVSVETWRMTQFKTIGTITLPGAINASVTSITVSDATNIATGDQIILDQEALSVTGKTGNVLTVTRGATISTAAAHGSGALVNVCKWPTSVALLKQIMKDGVNQILATSPSSTIQGFIATRDTAQANISAFLAASLQ